LPGSTSWWAALPPCPMIQRSLLIGIGDCGAAARCASSAHTVATSTIWEGGIRTAADEPMAHQKMEGITGEETGTQVQQVAAARSFPYGGVPHRDGGKAELRVLKVEGSR